MQKPTFQGAILAALLTTTASFAASATPAHAITLLEFLRGGPGNSPSHKNEVPPPENIPASQLADPEPLPKVASPRYYTYKPDSERAIAVKAPDTPILAFGDARDAAENRLAMSKVKVEATDDVAKAVEQYYNNKGALIWVNDSGITDQAKSAMAALASADTVGLEPADYAVTVPQGLDTMDSDAKRQALMAFELSLSAKVLTYVQDTVRGRLDPNRISGYYDFKRKVVDLAPVLDIVRMSPDVEAYLRSRDPSNPQFVALKNELARLMAEDKQQQADVVKVPENTFIRPGQTSPDLPSVIAAIKAYSSDSLKVDHVQALTGYSGDQTYSPDLVQLVSDYQKEKGLKPDGVIGPATIRTMTGHSDAEKIQKVIVAMEELRWLPANLGPRYVLINAAAFHAYYYDDSQQKLAMKVVVGAPQHQTYFFQNMIQTVEFNPYWGVPRSIIVNEFLPKLRRDPSYLDKQGYQVSYHGRRVSSASLNWNTNPDVDVRQPPGSDNALGDLKILFPNSHAIYMHDTPAKSFFKRDMRALSHGCVRLSEPRVMAAAVMNTSVDDINQEIATGQNRAVQVPQKFPVYIAYFTAWPDKDGVVQYYNDIYGRDDATTKAFIATSTARGAHI
ncbi:L,D-transpeptidase family protein [Allorhizobium sp. BGMRC 0089]|uniref:L,D-transpeptidase family protein n=1 Tax=Allorhizobium sonneratiae TaxID=2934936 RepID=UPI0020343A57|nr:L,D-transpeptidase family protein [Allorhizobium sonneratiae]MCM2292806.1 L,D-transpeptidase family protein [Allorhizobium sonneratiae]